MAAAEYRASGGMADAHGGGRGARDFSPGSGSALTVKRPVTDALENFAAALRTRGSIQV
jgi:hypothetical protein